MKISVCMATYNGAAYIEQQLKSILSQLQPNDELIIIDDHSIDATVDLITRIGDSRVHIYRNNINMGVQKSFEKAIGLASGGIIFLSDQDDVWHPEKVSKFSEIFKNLPEVSMVLSDARIVDNVGRVVVESFFKRRGGFAPGIVANLVKNRYLGCVMAFRKNLLEQILPFPTSIPQHDMWIGLVNEVYGKAYYISTPLIDYRRHESNASSASSNIRGSFVQMFKWRWALLTSLVVRVCQIGIRNV
jgi:glycosyltransferase involved in cell wall biosynthesis